MFVIGIAGGTCSGKSTLTEALEKYYGERAVIMNMDKYFKGLHCNNLKVTPTAQSTTIAPITGREYVEHNHPDTLKLDELYRDFEAETAGEHELVIIEGLFALYLEPIRSKCNFKIFVDLPSDERLVRRIRRFEKFGQSFDEITDRYIDTVRFRHNELIEPTRWYADMVVNGIFKQNTVDIITAYVDSML